MIENNNEKRNKKITIALVVLVLLLVTIVGITYAYFSAKSEAGPQPITTAKVDLLVEVNPDATHVKDIKPTTWNSDMTQNDGNEDVVKIPIKVTNRSTIDINYDLFITPNGLALNEEDTDGDNKLLVGGNLSDIKYKLYEKTGTSLSENPIKEGDFTDGEAKQKIVANKEIKAQKEESSDNIQNYILYIYIENKTSAQNKLQGIDFNLDIEGVTPPTKTLSEAVLANETPIEKQPEFTTTSQDKGLFKLQDNSIAIASSSEESNSNNKGSIYYYRGAVTNNYVQFGTYTKNVTNKVYEGSEKDKQVAQEGDPMIWRIVRINEDGSVKLTAEHNIGDSWHVWNNNNGSYSNPDYVIDNGDGNKKDSNIKETVDNWYNETFGANSSNDENKKLDKLVLNTEFCNDRSDSYNGVKNRLYKDSGNTPPEPTLNCYNPDDIIKSKAGLITADEMIYAGALYQKGVSNNTTYLNNKTFFWTISPASSADAFNWDSSNLNLNYYFVPYTYIVAARPVITLSSDTVVASGNGTLGSPYLVKSK